jgi:hypothetical protein
MDEFTKVIIMMVVYIITLMFDINTKYKKCIENNPKVIFSLCLHRFISIFMYFGWIFNNKVILVIYILIFLILLIHWVTNDWKCILTQYENKKCGFSRKQNYDFVYKLFQKDIAAIVGIIFKIIVLIIVFYKLFKQ